MTLKRPLCGPACTKTPSDDTIVSLQWPIADMHAPAGFNWIFSTIGVKKGDNTVQMQTTRHKQSSLLKAAAKEVIRQPAVWVDAAF